MLAAACVHRAEWLHGHCKILMHVGYVKSLGNLGSGQGGQWTPRAVDKAGSGRLGQCTLTVDA